MPTYKVCYRYKQIVPVIKVECWESVAPGSKIVESSDMYVVPLQSVHLSAVGTFNKMTGAYFIDGIISGLVNDSDQVDNLEAVYRA